MISAYIVPGLHLNIVFLISCHQDDALYTVTFSISRLSWEMRLCSTAVYRTVDGYHVFFTVAPLGQAPWPQLHLYPCEACSATFACLVAFWRLQVQVDATQLEYYPWPKLYHLHLSSRGVKTGAVAFKYAIMWRHSATWQN